LQQEPDANGEEWRTYCDGVGERAMPPTRPLAHLKREITEKKWEEERKWVGSRTSRETYRMPKSQRPQGTVAGRTKRLTLRAYELRYGQARIR